MTRMLTEEQTEPVAFTCRDLVALVTAYLDGALSDAERRRFEAHLGECDGCTRHLEHMRTTIATLGHLREDDFPPDLRARFLTAFHEWKYAHRDQKLIADS